MDETLRLLCKLDHLVGEKILGILKLSSAHKLKVPVLFNGYSQGNLTEGEGSVQLTSLY